MAGVQVKQEAKESEEGNANRHTDRQRSTRNTEGETQETLRNLLGYSHSCYKFKGHGMNLLFKL